jgi:prepilin-type N-terminal cleavage/methylation domain-containing protein
MQPYVKRKSRSGMTLIELMVAVFVLAILAPGVYQGMIRGLEFNALSSQHLAASGLGREWLEQMRGLPYTSVTAANFPLENVLLNHVGVMDRIPVQATRSATIQELTSPQRKVVTVRVEWNHRGRVHRQEYPGAIFLKNEGKPTGPRGDVAGSIAINPNNSPNSAFLLTLPDGTSISRTELTQDHTGYSGAASQVRFQPQGNGSQNSLTLNGETFTIFNNNTYTLQGNDLQVQVYNTHVNNAGKAVGKWVMDVTGSNVQIQIMD